MIVHVVTFESEGSGGFNWFMLPEEADANYDAEQATYATFDERTTIARFDVSMPDLGSEGEITRWLEQSDVRGMVDNADRRIVVKRPSSQLNENELRNWNSMEVRKKRRKQRLPLIATFFNTVRSWAQTSWNRRRKTNSRYRRGLGPRPRQ